MSFTGESNFSSAPHPFSLGALCPDVQLFPTAPRLPQDSEGPAQFLVGRSPGPVEVPVSPRTNGSLVAGIYPEEPGPHLLFPCMGLEQHRNKMLSPASSPPLCSSTAGAAACGHKVCQSAPISLPFSGQPPGRLCCTCTLGTFSVAGEIVGLVLRSGPVQWGFRLRQDGHWASKLFVSPRHWGARV